MLQFWPLKTGYTSVLIGCHYAPRFLGQSNEIAALDTPWNEGKSYLEWVSNIEKKPFDDEI